MMHILTFAVGIFVGYWAYPVYMMIKLYRIKRRIEEIERGLIGLKEDLHGEQWNEDKL